MDSAVIIRVGDMKKSTKVKHHSDSPYYNEYFVFEFNTTYDKVIDKYITIKVIQPGNVWRKRKTLGEVLLDIATVWNQKGRQFYHKWAILSAPKGQNYGGPRGYIKLDISVLAKGETPKLPTHIINDDIEGNLLLPGGIYSERQRAEYRFDIYRWEYSEKYPQVEEKKRSIYVEVTFAGITTRTLTKKYTPCTIFNERLRIVELFPPLCQRIKVEICSGDSMKKTVYASKYINLKSISNEEEDGFLPTFGPIFLNMYSITNLEGYVGTILMSMNTELEEINTTTAVDHIVPLDERLKLSSIEDIFQHQDVKSYSNEIGERLLDILDYIQTSVRKYIDIVSAYNIDYNTKLDKERMKLCFKKMQNFVTQTEIIEHNNTKKKMFRKLQELCKSVEELIEDVQECWPDIFLWILHGSKKVAFLRIPARDIIYSPVVEEKGQHCGLQRSTCCYIKGKKQEILVCKMTFLSTLCFNRHKTEAITNVFDGFQFDDKNDSLPRKVIAQEKYVFDLEVYIFQGKISAGFDKSGLADPFVRIIVADQVKETQIINQCLNPIWDETLKFGNLTFYGSREFIKNNIPTILMEVYDKDPNNTFELIGRTIIKPKLNLKEEPKVIPKLNWQYTYDQYNVTSEILMASEYTEVTEESILTETSKPNEIMRIPSTIKPDLVSCKMEVLFWGVRDLKSVNLLSINRPRISVYCGDNVIHSDTIQNAKQHSNFSNRILPRQNEYAPPLTLKIFDSRRFGVYVYAGVHITNILPFLLVPMTSEDRNQKLSGIGYKSTESLTSKSSSVLEPAKEIMSVGTAMDDIDRDGPSRNYFSLFGCLTSLCKTKRRGERRIKKSTTVANYELLPQEDDFDISDFDWWSKFYRSLGETENSEENRKIQKLKVYESDLESQSEFKGFTDMLTSFDMYKGKRTGDDALDDENITAVFKGSIKIYPWPSNGDQNYVTLSGQPLTEGYFKNFPDNIAMRYILRVYCVRALGLRPKDLNGKSDPFLRLILNKNVINDRDNVIMRQVNPDFGRCFEFNAMFPRDHSLIIEVWDYDMSSSDDLIGRTKIDLERRYYSKHRPNCGLPETYQESGYCEWAAPSKPTVILADLCKKWKTDKPEYEEDCVRIGFKTFSPSNFSVSEDPNFDKEVLALAALRRWNEMPVVGFPLVPEHVETRSLYDAEKPGIEQGKLQLWIDILPVTDLPAPKKVNITPRKAVKYELRVIIWNVQEVLLGEDDFFTGEKKSDIYVKGWLTDSSEAQYTDVHYRSLTGEGNYNWRFVFPFEYLSTENKMVVRRKEATFSMDETEFKIPCKLTLQVWDNDAFSADDFIGFHLLNHDMSQRIYWVDGTLTLELARLYRGAKIVSKCYISTAEKGSRTINLFKIRRTKGWWPFRSIDPGTKKDTLAGKVEAELELLTMEQAIAEPAGLARNEPQALAPPKRPDTSFSWFKNPLMALKFAFCKVYKWKLIKCLLICLLMIFAGLGLYAFPGYGVKKILGV